MSPGCTAFEAVDSGTVFPNCLRDESHSLENTGNVIESGSFDDFAADNVAFSREVDDTCSSLGSPRNGDMAVFVCIAGTRILLYNLVKYCDAYITSPREPTMSNSIDAVENPCVLFCGKGKIRQKGKVDVVL